jgi:DNA-binding response OmpR family regulator
VGSTPAARTSSDMQNNLTFHNKEPQPAGARFIGGRKHILLLEDEGGLTDVLKTHLEMNGYEVSAVASGVEGLKLVMGRDFDVIICDMMMPTLAGDMFYIAVERIKPHLCKRFVFMSGFKGEKKIDDFIRKIQGILLWKPFEMNDLMDTIQLVLRTTGK